MPSKRERDSTDATIKSKKRQKLESNNNTTRRNAGQPVGTIVNVDELDWKSVALPDRLEDAEGFLGLEEIEGVDIVKPQGNRRVKFKVRDWSKAGEL